MKGPKKLIESEDHWVTNMGAWFPGERVILRGKDLFHDLKDLNWIGLLTYGVTGRVFSEKQLRLFEGLWMLTTSYPDPRLWNNRVAALAGTNRSTRTLGVSAAIAVSEARIYGHGTNVRTLDFLLRTKKHLDDGIELTELILDELHKYRVVSGYGRPIVNNDERIVAVVRLAEELGFAEGEYVKLAFQIEKILLEGRWRMRMNIGALNAALVADQGLNINEYHLLSIPSFIAGIIPCIFDTMEKPAGSFFPLRCNRLKYGGKSRRVWK